MKSKPHDLTVSICSITFNHAPYIRQCLDGFLMQKCNFKYEILIHDDASTDGTQEIIREYVEKYPEIIKPIFQTENQWSQGIRNIQSRYNFSRAKGKYIALCEGDDYWTDPLKLQKQVDFLEKNDGFSLVFSNAKVLIEVDKYSSNFNRGLKLLDTSKLFLKNEILDDWTIPTASVLFRNDLRNYYDIAQRNEFIYGDIVLFLYLGSIGKIYGMHNEFVVYRRHEGGITNVKSNVGFDYKYYKHLITIFNVFGNDLRTKKMNKLVAKLELSLALNYLNNKNFFGFIYLYKTIVSDKSIIIDYLKSKL